MTSGDLTKVLTDHHIGTPNSTQLADSLRKTKLASESKGGFHLKPGSRKVIHEWLPAGIDGMQPATVAVLEEAGYKTLDDIIDLEREDFLRLPGIAPEEADRLMAIINELTTDEGGESADETAGSEAASSGEPTQAADDAANAEGTKSE